MSDLIKRRIFDMHVELFIDELNENYNIINLSMREVIEKAFIYASKNSVQLNNKEG